MSRGSVVKSMQGSFRRRFQGTHGMRLIGTDSSAAPEWRGCRLGQQKHHLGCVRSIEHQLPQDVMDSDGDAAMENGGAEASANNGGSYDAGPAVPVNSICEECEDRRSVWDCKEGCGGVFCTVCFHALHRKGKRALHKPEKIIHAEPVGTGGGGKGLVSGWIGPRLPAQREVANPDMYDRSGTVCGLGVLVRLLSSGWYE